MARNTLSIVLAGGKGSRLYPLTRDRAKPAVPFGGMYRTIDFVLSNLYHSEKHLIQVLTQYKPYSLHEHIRFGWYPLFGAGRDENIDVRPATGGDEGASYMGTADAVARNAERIRFENPQTVLIFCADHIYFMDAAQFEDYHLDKGGDLTISARVIERSKAAGNYGVLGVDPDWRVTDFEEKPADPKPIPGSPDHCLVSMGIYAFKREPLLEYLARDEQKRTVKDRKAAKEDPDHCTGRDFGHDIIPMMLRGGASIYVYDFMTNIVPGVPQRHRGYWRDIGTLDESFLGNMELLDPDPPVDPANRDWPLQTCVTSFEPALLRRKARVSDSILSNGVIIDGARVEHSIISPMVKVDSGARITNSIILGKSRIGDGAVIENSIVDKHVIIPKGEIVGVDRKLDLSRGFTISEGGITVVPHYYRFPEQR